MKIITKSGVISMRKASRNTSIVRGWIDAGGWSGVATLASVEKAGIDMLESVCKHGPYRATHGMAYAIGYAMARQSRKEDAE